MTTMRVFELHRDEDETGVSGTGVVAQGVEFDNGWCALTWLSEHTSVAFYPSLTEVVAIHGHHGKTRVIVAARVDTTQRSSAFPFAEVLDCGCWVTCGGHEKEEIET